MTNTFWAMLLALLGRSRMKAWEERRVYSLEAMGSVLHRMERLRKGTDIEHNLLMGASDLYI